MLGRCVPSMKAQQQLQRPYSATPYSHYQARSKPQNFKINDLNQHCSPPINCVLAQYREAEANFNQQRAKLRREAQSSRKRANQLEMDYKKLKQLYEHRCLDVKALKMALKNRDIQIKESQQRAKELESQLGKNHDQISDQMAALAVERDDLQALLTATLHRLEEVDHAVQKAEESSKAMEEKVRQLEEERQKAVDFATVANAELSYLKANQDKFQWQSSLLEKMSEIQSKHQQRKKVAMQRLMSASDEDEENSLHPRKVSSTTEEEIIQN